MIHPTAIIDPKAQIGEGCEIGPYCVIGPDVTLGPRCRLHAHVVIGGHTRLGSENDIYPFASIGLKTQDLKWKGGITRTEIGDRNIIRENVTIHSATGDGEVTVIGSDNAILANSHIAHNVVLGNRVILSMTTLAGHIVVEDSAVIGGLTAVHQFCRVGTMAIVGGCSKVVQDVPPYMLAEGHTCVIRTINKVGLERNGVPEETQAVLRRAQKILCRDGLTITNALARIEQELPPLKEIQHLVAFIRASERGICR